MTRFIPFIASILLLIAGIAAFTLLCVRIDQAVSVAAAARSSAMGTDQQGTLQKSIAALVQSTESQRAELSGFVAKDADVVSLIDTIDGAAKRDKVSVTIGSVSVEPAEDWKYHEPLRVELSAQGSFAALAAFATDMESLPTASRVVSAGAESAENHTWFGTFTLEFVKEKAP